MNTKEIEFILKNQKHYRNIIKYFLLESSQPNNDINVQNNRHGNGKEKSYLNKFENEEYKKAQNIIKAIERMEDKLTERQKRVYYFRYKIFMEIERIGFELHYGTTTIYNELQAIRKILNTELNKVYCNPNAV